MLVPWKSLTGMQTHTANFNWGAEWKRQWLAAEEEREVTTRYFSTHGRPPGDGGLIKIPGTDDIGSRQQLAVGGEELVLGKDGLEEDVAHPQQGGGGTAGVPLIFK